MKNIESFLSARQEIELLWLFGDWKAIMGMQVFTNESLDELSYYKLAALYQLGKMDEAKLYLKTLSEPKKDILKKLLISGVYNCLAKANHLIEEREKADSYFSASIDILGANEIASNMKNIRRAEQLTQLEICQHWVGFSNSTSVLKRNKLFIDCGGHDGCSIIKFFLSNSGYDAITFEANPELWKYYSNLPTKLIGKAVYNYDGEVEFIIDPIDADGSSLIKGKDIDFHKKVKNEDCPRINIQCVDLSLFIKEQSEKYDEIILKLDVEGAEYEILEKMLKDKTISCIKKLYAEFHWHKIGIPQEKHDELIETLNQFITIEHWDAHEFSVHEKDKSAIKRRYALVDTLGG